MRKQIKRKIRFFFFFKVDASKLRQKRRDLNRKQVWSACLPNTNEPMGPDGETFVVAGWGLTKTRLIRVSNKGFWNDIYKKKITNRFFIVQF